MRPATVDFRCKQCSTLLAKIDRDGLTIRRGDMQATVTGVAYTVSVACYRCKTLNVSVPTPAVGIRSGAA